MNRKIRKPKPVAGTARGTKHSPKGRLRTESSARKACPSRTGQNPGKPLGTDKPFIKRTAKLFASLGMFSLIIILSAVFIDKNSFFQPKNKSYGYPSRGEIPAVKKPFLYFFQSEKIGDSIKRIRINRKNLEGAYLEDVLQALLEGPNKKELKNGIVSALPPGCRILGMKYIKKNREVRLNFNKSLESEGGRNIIQRRIEQIVLTATQIPEVNRVSFQINGLRVLSLSGDGIVLPQYITRKTLDQFRI